MADENIVQCPRCGSPMRYVLETEKYNDGARKITGYYICPVCRYKMAETRIEVGKKEKGLVLMIVKLSQKRRGGLRKSR